MKGLSEKQQAIVDFIEEFQLREGMSPAVHEIADNFQISCTTAFTHLRALQRKGYVDRSSRARSLSLKKNESSPNGINLLSIPVLGRISAGSLLQTEEHVEDVLQFDPKMLPRGTKPEGIFGLKIFGNSMKDLGILDGDIVIARQSDTPKNGDVVVALVEDETTVKSLFVQGKRAELRPANSEYKSQFYPLDKVFVQGIVIALMRTF